MSQIKLPEIILPIQQELESFNDKFKSSIKSKVGLVDLVTKYILKQKGKKIRPVLVLLSAGISGGISDRSYRGAVLVEMLHTATLVHDDVVDAAETRRGLPSINAVWKNKVAVLIGDYLLSRGLMLAVDGNDFDFLRIVTDTVKRMSEGELLQISKTRKLDIDEETYYKIISDKTASLISTCCEIGAKSATQNEGQIQAMRSFGEALGIAFQIKDDILDYTGKTKILGKPLGGDIKEKKITLPLIYSLKNVDKSEAKRIINLIKSERKKGRIQEVIDFVLTNGGIEYAEKEAEKWISKAKESLNTFAESQYKQSLTELVDFVVQRRN
ncbi:MAG: polyprenyl synthetase family protein [Melioribacteraceae bacterium]|nr:MAG: polyprenyl synthetase family protein [Melioribacteraceae bacterium]